MPANDNTPESFEEVKKAVRRLALLHLAFAETLVKELGEKEGKKMIVKAIRNYGLKVGGKKKKEAQARGLPLTVENFDAVPGEPYPSKGGHDKLECLEIDNKTIVRAHGCVLAKVWQEYGGEELGRLYCLIDPAQYMAYNPDVAFVHRKAMPDGDEFCEFEFRQTTDQEKKDFAEDGDWSYLDKVDI